MLETLPFHKLTVTSGLNMFYLRLVIGLISSRKYWRVEKGVIQVKLYFYEILTKIQTKAERLNFSKK